MLEPFPEFEWQEETTAGDPRRVITLYGAKGTGKSVMALGFPGRLYVVSLDDKSQRVWADTYNKDPRITVVSATKYMAYGRDEMVAALSKTHAYVLFLLDKIEKRGDADWIVIDGLERLTKCAEGVMREKFGLDMTANFANLGFWKERRRALAEAFFRALNVSKRGLILTTYQANEDTFIEAGRTVQRKQVPRWIEVPEEMTDIVIRVYPEFNEEKKSTRFFAYIVSSKFSDVPTGAVVDVTHRTLGEAVAEWKEKHAEPKTGGWASE